MVAIRRSKIFRVRGLPRDADGQYLEAATRAQLTAAETENALFKVLDVVPSCSDQSFVGLVEFKTAVPTFLQTLVEDPTTDWGIDYNDTDLFFDCHFYGMTQMYNTKADEKIKVDIVAITGLDGHAFGSWRGRGNLGRMWLRDFLSVDMPNCRTMTYGYKLKLSRPNNASLLDYSREFLSDMASARESREESQRPLIFIAHSFGGILLANSLIRASNNYSDPAWGALYKATYGIFFFGVPHKGLIVEDMCNMSRFHSGEQQAEFLERLNHESETLYEQANELADLIQDRRIVTFYETEGTNRLVFNNEEKRWERTGPPVPAVTARSATLQLPQSMEDKYPLHQDHSNMVKFDSKADKGYDKTVRKLHLFEEDAAEVVHRRFIPAKLGASGTVRASLELQSHELSPLGFHVHRPELEQRLQLATEIKSSKPTKSQRLVALCGPAGSGKSQLARNHVSVYNKSYNAIFWIHARGNGSIAGDIRKHHAWMAENSKTAPCDLASLNSVLNAFLEWFRLDTGRHLVVFDQADSIASDDPALLVDLARYLPRSKTTDIIVTTQCTDVQFLPGFTLIPVEALTASEAAELFFDSVGIREARETQANNVAAVTQELEYQALALALAGKNVFKTPKLRRNVTGYLDKFSECRTAIAKRSAIITAARWNQRIYAAWEVSFLSLRHRSRSAARLMALLSFVCDEEVSYETFRLALKQDEDNSDSSDSDGDSDSSSIRTKAKKLTQSFNPFGTSQGDSSKKEQIKGIFKRYGKPAMAQVKDKFEGSGKAFNEWMQKTKEGETASTGASTPKKAKDSESKKSRKSKSSDTWNVSSDIDKVDSVASSLSEEGSDSGESSAGDEDNVFPEFDDDWSSGWVSLVTPDSSLEPSDIEEKLELLAAYGLLRRKQSRPPLYTMNDSTAAWCRQRYRMDTEVWMCIGFPALLFLRDATLSCPDDAESRNRLARPVSNFWQIFCRAPKVAGHGKWFNQKYIVALVHLANFLLVCKLYDQARDLLEFASERSAENVADDSTLQLIHLRMRDLSATGYEGSGRRSKSKH